MVIAASTKWLLNIWVQPEVKSPFRFVRRPSVHHNNLLTSRVFPGDRWRSKRLQPREQFIFTTSTSDVTTGETKKTSARISSRGLMPQRVVAGFQPMFVCPRAS